MAAKYPYLPIWTDALLADTNDLPPGDFGIYVLMLILAWRRKDCALPDDMQWLKRSLQSCCVMHGHTFNAVVPKLLKRYWKKTKGKWYQARLQKEFKYVSNRSQNNRKAALVRWNNKDLADANAIPLHPHPTLVSKKESKTDLINGNGFRAKPRHGQESSKGRIWLDANTADFTAYSKDYWDKHHAPVPLLWHESGAWFNKSGE